MVLIRGSSVRKDSPKKHSWFRGHRMPAGSAMCVSMRSAQAPECRRDYQGFSCHAETIRTAMALSLSILSKASTTL